MGNAVMCTKIEVILKKLLLVITIIIITNCTEKSDHNQIKLNSLSFVNIKFNSYNIKVKSETKNILLGSLVPNIDTTVTNQKELIFSISIPTPSYTISYINNYKYNLFLSPDDTLYLELINNKLNVIGQNDIANINRFYLDEVYKKNKELTQEFMKPYYTTNSQTKFTLVTDSLKKIIYKNITLGTNKYNLPTWFNEYEKLNNNYLQKLLLNTFGYACGETEVREGVTKQKVTSSDLEKLILNDEDVFYSDIYFMFLESTIAFNFITDKNFYIPIAGKTELLEYFHMEFNVANQYLRHCIKNIYKTRILSGVTKYHGKQIVDDFKKESNDDYFNTKYYNYLLNKIN